MSLVEKLSASRVINSVSSAFVAFIATFLGLPSTGRDINNTIVGFVGICELQNEIEQKDVPICK